jgi:hypothetical protein
MEVFADSAGLGIVLDRAGFWSLQLPPFYLVFGPYWTPFGLPRYLPAPPVADYFSLGAEPIGCAQAGSLDRTAPTHSQLNATSLGDLADDGSGLATGTCAADDDEEVGLDTDQRLRA